MALAAVYSLAEQALTETGVILLSGGRQGGHFPQMATHSPSVGDRHKPFHRMLIWRAISLQVGVVEQAPPPPARTAAFQFYIKPITLLGLLKRVLHDKIGSELWNYHQHPRSHFLPCSSFIPTLCYLHSFHLIFHFLSSWLSLSSAPLSECSSAMAACKNGIWWGWYQTARPKSHFLLVKETRSAQKWLCTIWLILNPLWYLI